MARARKRKRMRERRRESAAGPASDQRMETPLFSSSSFPPGAARLACQPTTIEPTHQSTHPTKASNLPMNQRPAEPNQRAKPESPTDQGQVRLVRIARTILEADERKTAPSFKEKRQRKVSAAERVRRGGMLCPSMAVPRNRMAPSEQPPPHTHTHTERERERERHAHTHTQSDFELAYNHLYTALGSRHSIFFF